MDFDPDGNSVHDFSSKDVVRLGDVRTKLKTILDTTQLTQSDLSDCIGVSQSTVSEIYNGNRIVTHSFACKFYDCLSNLR
jgi:plasmid maintenance system antidote protein VapI